MQPPPWLALLPALAGPRYLAIAESIVAAVHAGTLRPGDRLPPHRDLAQSLGLNVSTVTRAYAEAQRRGLTRGETGRGTFITLPPGEDGPSSLWKGLAAPGFVDLSHNFPPTAPADSAAAAVEAALLSGPDLRRLLPSQTGAGLPEHRAAGAAWLGRFGIPATADDVVVTSGGQHGLLLAMAAQTRQGDPVLTEERGFYGLKSVAAMLGRPLVPVRMDQEGLMPDSLDAACRRTGARLLVCAPTLHNPTTATMPLERRHAILRVCERHGLGLVEDDVYNFLMETPIPPFAALAPERTTYVTSVSKVIGPGWRIGFLRAPRDLSHQIGTALRATTLMASTIAAEIVARLVRGQALEGVAARLREEIRARQRLVGATLGVPQALRHPSAFHVWLKLGPRWTEDAFVRAAEARGVGVTPGSVFEVGPLVRDDAVRICVNAAASREVLERSLETLRALFLAQPAAAAGG
ncbi:PLP-dependent aminotransferase family protein [Roseomonas sp. NAR14]|uniref:PLP-dependent aminotransferase family protein n=1 Tax=Roseomonas acroporae TaxID=2937791 RepID=A0A9X2BT95_9PROT|nr:PLP-dependent aminotransferase family protein [Roseomonas acroporae]MCK8784408.1 PLP-dependent aminotransferase family protein [Roseomonas acroporae]